MAAEILGYSASYVRRLLLKGKLRGERFGHDWIVSTMEVNRFKRKLEQIKLEKELINGNKNSRIS